MHYNINRETIDAMMNETGEICGKAFKSDEKFILKKGGREKLLKAQEEIEEMGEKIVYRDIKEKEFYPWGKRILSLLSIGMVFNMDKERIEEMGRFASKRSNLISFFIKNFSTPKMELKKFVKSWRRCNTIGRVEIVAEKSKNRESVIRLYNLNLHPIFCDYLCGYLKGIAQKATRKEVSCEETRCYFRGEKFFHEFLLKW